MKKTTIQMNGWFNTRCDLMAWDGEDSMEKLRGTKKGECQAMAWRPKNLARVKKEVLAFSWGTNQAMMFMFMWGSNHYWSVWWKWLDTFGIIQNWWMESSHVLKMAMLKWKDQYQHVDTLTWWRLKRRHKFKRDQLKRYKFIFPLILSLIGMPYY